MCPIVDVRIHPYRSFIFYSIKPHCRAHLLDISQRRTNTKTRVNVGAVRVDHLWNSLPDAVITEFYTEAFENRLKVIYFHNQNALLLNGYIKQKTNSLPILPS